MLGYSLGFLSVGTNFVGGLAIGGSDIGVISRSIGVSKCGVCCGSHGERKYFTSIRSCLLLWISTFWGGSGLFGLVAGGSCYYGGLRVWVVGGGLTSIGLKEGVHEQRERQVWFFIIEYFPSRESFVPQDALGRNLMAILERNPLRRGR